MIRIVISGCNGRMGRVVDALCREDPQVEVAAGFDVLGQGDQLSYPVFSAPAQFTGEAEVVIDFSHPAALDGLLDFSVSRHIPLVLATTGYSPEQLAQIGAAAREVPIFRSANMSLGINVVIELVKKAASILGDRYDIEIVERHHNKKLDAPSGPALLLADRAAEACPHETRYVYDRHSVRQPRDPREIGISSVRGGTIVGVHEVIFAGHDEVIELKHTAMSREIFAQGALAAAKFLAGVGSPGLYDMSHIVG